MLYMLLSRCNHLEPTDINEYDPGNLLLHEHDFFMVQAKSLQTAHIDKDYKELTKAYSIKGVPLLSTLTSLRFPQSFPYNFMHVMILDPQNFIFPQHLSPLPLHHQYPLSRHTHRHQFDPAPCHKHQCHPMDQYRRPRPNTRGNYWMLTKRPTMQS
jgi:hypothetical protein